MSELLECEKVLEILGVTRQALYAGIKRGTCPAPVPGSRGAGKRSLWRRDDIDAHLQGRGERASLRARCAAAGAGPLLEGCDAALLGYTNVESGLAPAYDRAMAIGLLQAAGLRDAQKWATEGAGADVGVVWIDR